MKIYETQLDIPIHYLDILLCTMLANTCLILALNISIVHKSWGAALSNTDEIPCGMNCGTNHCAEINQPTDSWI